ncbi:hypothetical protein DPMN_004660 [Dreissena polymorpha]|uniref:Gamma tubulin complex component protein N-terminal domain-containing protein n=2 Tax=Dreissena polymorpha TaxID=45954 RepID=A0A9D4RVV3_DREPO|nr:hypothetical protein DPMN_004660 [Dreissena polymorpha]
MCSSGPRAPPGFQSSGGRIFTRNCYGMSFSPLKQMSMFCRDKHYWTHGYTLATDLIDDSVPLFLRDLARDIFVCGKSINLLKAFNRQHFFCDLEDQYIPHMLLTFSEMELRVTRECVEYASCMTQNAAQASLSSAPVLFQGSAESLILYLMKDHSQPHN